MNGRIGHVVGDGDAARLQNAPNGHRQFPRRGPRPDLRRALPALSKVVELLPRVLMPSLGCLAVPPTGFGIILRHTAATSVLLAELEHRVDVVLVSGGTTGQLQRRPAARPDRPRTSRQASSALQRRRTSGRQPDGTTGRLQRRPAAHPGQPRTSRQARTSPRLDHRSRRHLGTIGRLRHPPAARPDPPRTSCQARTSPQQNPVKRHAGTTGRLHHPPAARPSRLRTSCRARTSPQHGSARPLGGTTAELVPRRSICASVRGRTARRRDHRRPRRRASSPPPHAAPLRSTTEGLHYRPAARLGHGRISPRA